MRVNAVKVLVCTCMIDWKNRNAIDSLSVFVFMDDDDAQKRRLAARKRRQD